MIWQADVVVLKGVLDRMSSTVQCKYNFNDCCSSQVGVLLLCEVCYCMPATELFQIWVYVSKHFVQPGSPDSVLGQPYCGACLGTELHMALSHCPKVWLELSTYITA